MARTTTVVTRTNGAFVFIAGMAIDVDGSPRAYGPPGGAVQPLDDIRNAGHRGNWWGIAVDENDEPYVQGPNDPAPGFYVSTTALVDRTRATRDPRRYVDAEHIPYVVIPPELQKLGVRIGDLAMVEYAGARAPAIVADIGPSNHYGEGSMALAKQLGIPSSPRHGGVGGDVRYIIFEGSAGTPPWPRDVLEFQADAARRYAAWMRA
jgi:hypothetical protein